MSYVRKEKNGYRGYATYYVDGKKKNKSVGKFRLRKDALKKAQELENNLNTANVDLQELPFATYFEQWFYTYKFNKLAQATINRYLANIKVIKRYFKDKKTTDIKRSEYQQFINWYGKDHAISSVKKINNYVKNCLSYAIDDDIISKDFTEKVELVGNSDKEYKVEYLNSDELIILKNAVKNHLNGLSVTPYMILTAIYTGMRKSEVQALTWKDIDFLHGTISINKAWDENTKTFKTTKTESSNRTIPVPPILLNALKDLRGNHSTMVFKNKLGNIPLGNSLNKMLRSIMDNAGISKQGFHFHSLRHVHVAFLIFQGVDIYVISKRLGHSKVSTTLDIYSYLIDEYKAKNDNLIIDKLNTL